MSGKKKKVNNNKKEIVKKYTDKDIPEIIDNLWYVPIHYYLHNNMKLFNIELNKEIIGMEYRLSREPFQDSPPCLYLINQSFSSSFEAAKKGGNIEPICLNDSYFPTFNNIESLIKKVIIIK